MPKNYIQQLPLSGMFDMLKGRLNEMREHLEFVEPEDDPGEFTEELLRVAGQAVSLLEPFAHPPVPHVKPDEFGEGIRCEKCGEHIIFGHWLQSHKIETGMELATAVREFADSHAACLPYVKIHDIVQMAFVARFGGGCGTIADKDASKVVRDIKRAVAGREDIE